MSEHASRPPRSLGVTADLTVSVDGATADVKTTGSRIVVDVTSIVDAYRLLRAVRRGHGLLDVFRRTDLTVDVRIRGETVAVVGRGATPGLLSGLLAPGPVEIRPRGLFAGNDTG